MKLEIYGLKVLNKEVLFENHFVSTIEHRVQNHKHCLRQHIGKMFWNDLSPAQRSESQHYDCYEDQLLRIK